MVIEGFRGSSGGGSIGGGGGMGGGHETQLSFSGVGGRPSATGFQHQVQPSSNFDRYNSGNDRDRDHYRDHDRNNNNNVIHVGGGGGGYDRNHWNGYYPPYTYYNPLMYQDRQPTEIVINEDKDNNKSSKNKMDETVKILLIVFICLFAIVMLFMLFNLIRK
jgi:hypothetical protein